MKQGYDLVAIGVSILYNALQVPNNLASKDEQFICRAELLEGRAGGGEGRRLTSKASARNTIHRWHTTYVVCKRANVERVVRHV